MSEGETILTHWSKRRLGDITQVRTGKLDANAQRPGGPYPFFTCGEETLEIDHFAFDTEAILLAGNGNFNVKWYHGKFNAYQRTYVIEPNGVFGKWLFYAVQAALRTITKGNRGSVIRFLRIGDIVNSTVSVPPLPEQRRIVAEIEKQFSRLEEGVSALKRVQANLKRYRAAVLKAACEGRLGPTEKWTITTIRDVTSIVTKGSSPNWQGFEYCDDGVVFVRSQNVCWGKIDLSDVAHLPAGFNEKEKKSVLKVGDVLLNIVGASIGRAAIATNDVAGGNVNQAVAVIRCQQEKILPQFLMLYLLSPSTQTLIHSQAVDVARANFSLGDISKMSVPLPTLSEQKRIVEEVERRLSVVEEIESLVTTNLQRATRLRQAILQRAFSGELI